MNRAGSLLLLPTAAYAAAGEGDGRARLSEVGWYEAKEDETPRSIAAALGVDLAALLAANVADVKGLRADARLREGTLLRALPAAVAAADAVAQ